MKLVCTLAFREKSKKKRRKFFTLYICGTDRAVLDVGRARILGSLSDDIRVSTRSVPTSCAVVDSVGLQRFSSSSSSTSISLRTFHQTASLLNRIVAMVCTSVVVDLLISRSEHWMAVLHCTCRPTVPGYQSRWRAISIQTPIIHIRPTDSTTLQPGYCRQAGLSNLCRQSPEHSPCISHLSTVAYDFPTSA